MNISYFNGNYLSKEEVKISPDDRGFLFADGVYEVVRWYKGYFFDMDSHVLRLKRSLREINIEWSGAGDFPTIARDLIIKNELENKPAMVYLQVTRGVARRSHNFPPPETTPTIYASAWGFSPDDKSNETGIKVLLKEDIRWSRCDIKSVALLPNTLSFQEAHEKGLKECIFVRNGLVTEATHSNIFFILRNTLVTHPESNHILSGVTRKNVLRIAHKAGIRVVEEALNENMLGLISEAFLSSTSSEVVPVVEIGGTTVGNGLVGPVTRVISELFRAETDSINSR